MQTILLDYSKWLPRRMIVLDHSPTLATRGIVVYGMSTIYWTIFVTKMIVCSRPFFELENDCPLEILDHFLDWKVTSQPRPFSKLENDCPYINNILVLPPNLGVITSFSNKEFISTSPILSIKYVNFSSWTEDLPKYMLFSHQWRHPGEPLLPSGLYHKETNTWSQCALTCHGTMSSLKASHNYDYHNISRSNPTPDQTVQKLAYRATLRLYKHHKLQYTMILQCWVQHTSVSC